MEYDYVIIGSGFGGSVSALRLSEKGYKVLVIEKGRWYSKQEDFPKTSWDLKKYLWAPKIGLKGLFKITQFKHVGILSGVGVGGGSLVYANTLPIPKDKFYTTGNWKNLNDWKTKLAPYYQLAYKMLGAAKVEYEGEVDKVWKELAKEIDREEHLDRTKVSVFLGKPGVEVKDPYFDGKGPSRTGCIYCAKCTIGCKYNAKNTLDKNYLYLAQQLGCEIIADSKVVDVNPLSNNGENGYEITFKNPHKTFAKKKVVKTKGVIFSGGVLGSVELLLDMKHKNRLPNLSDKLGDFVRTNSESLLSITNIDKTKDFSKGVAIGSIIHTDEKTHIEPTNLGAGNGFTRLITIPVLAFGKNFLIRFFQVLWGILKSPIKFLKTITIKDYGKQTFVLLFMQTMEESISLKRSFFGGMKSAISNGNKPQGFIPYAKEIAEKLEKITNGKAGQQVTQTILGGASTAHILGGCCMGETKNEGVVDKNNKVFGYDNMYVIDGSMISSNPGVNPSLSITAIAEHAMAQIPSKENL